MPHLEDDNYIIPNVAGSSNLKASEENISNVLLAVDEGRELWGISYSDLTYWQKVLYNKYKDNPSALAKLNDVITIVEGEIQFPNIWLAIQDKDNPYGKLNKIWATKVTKEVGEPWRLPNDNWSTEKEGFLSLDAENSDYDRMILQMPWESDEVQAENFALLTDMKWFRYRTWTAYNNLTDYSVVRDFDDYVGSIWSRHKRDNKKNDVFMRLIKEIPKRSSFQAST